MQEDKDTPQLHPAFLKEEVYIADCSCCSTNLCKRGMMSFLVADDQVELYSTDQVDKSLVDLTDEIYKTEKCSCLIQNMACLLCGSVVGYHVERPCRPCLQSKNNGHYWMFFRAAIIPGSRLNKEGTDRLLWKDLPVFKQDINQNIIEECER